MTYNDGDVLMITDGPCAGCLALVSYVDISRPDLPLFADDLCRETRPNTYDAIYKET